MTALTAALAAGMVGAAIAGEPAWMDKTQSADARARAIVAEMTLDEKLQLLKSSMPMMMRKRPEDAVFGAGYVPGIERLGVPSQRMTDASLGVANLLNMRRDDVATALPSSLALASSWNGQLAFESGAMIGSEARAKGFNVMLAGGVNLAREPRNGRNFEYPGEDPLLAGVIAGESIRGVQSNGIVSTVKHFALNDQETGRSVLNVKIGQAAARESDLLALQIAIERGQPGSVMTAYNRVNGDYASESDWLLNKVLKGDWGYPGWVMSDWGNVHSAVKAALAGLDQQSGAELDAQIFFGEPLKAAVEQGEVPAGRVDDMAARILRSLIAAGVYDDPPQPGGSIDFEAHAQIAQRAAEQGIVLLKNAGDILPLAGDVESIAVIGGHADVGVLSGGGSTQVRPVGGPALEIRLRKGPAAAFARRTYFPSSPLAALQARFPKASVRYADGNDLAGAQALAREAQVAIVFGEEWRTEAMDNPSMALDENHDALIAAVAQANPDTIVVLQTGGAVLMPWLGQVRAAVEAWYPGQRGGEAIAAVLAGDVDASGRLPITFPASAEQLPRPVIDGINDDSLNENANYAVVKNARPFDIDYDIDGADVGYRWFARQGHAPLFPFGYGLSYTEFAYSGLRASGGKTVMLRARVRNSGSRAGIATPQFYALVASRGGKPVPRLVGWRRVALQPGEQRDIEVRVDPRLLAEFDTALPGWRVHKRRVRFYVGSHVGDEQSVAKAAVAALTLPP